MSNTYVNKVLYGNTPIIDITDTTATASDVIAGKTFYGATGEKVTGTAQQPGSIWQDSNGRIHLSSNGNNTITPLTVTENGTYTSQNGGYNPVVVNIASNSSQYHTACLNIATSTSCTITHNNATYSNNGDTFLFEAGDTITVSLSARSGCAIYQNNTLIKSSNVGIAIADITLPANNIIIATATVNITDNRVDINDTSATSITLTSNGTYAVAGYNEVIVNVSN